MSDQRWNVAFRSQGLLVSMILLGLLALISSQSTSAKQSGNLPQAVDLNPAKNILETNLVAREAEVDLGNGLLAKAVTFNGAIPGPELRLQVGDKVIVHFTNLLPEGFTIHWHGIELNNASDGTGITQNAVKTGESFDYAFVVPRPGLYFYHSHIEPTNPEFKGYFGPIIIEDPAEDKLRAKGVLPDRKETFTLVLSDTTVCKAAGSNDAVTFPADPTLPWVGTEELAGNPAFPGLLGERTPVSMCETPIDNAGRFPPGPTVPLAAGSIPNIQPSHDNPQCAAGCRTNEGQIVLTNGKITAPRGGSPSQPGAVGAGANIFDIKEGAGVRLQLASATSQRYIRLRLTDQNGQQVTLFRVGGQGGLLDRVRVEGGTLGTFDTQFNRGEILVAASERSDVVFTMPQGKNGDIVTLWTQDFERIGGGVLGSNFSGLPTVPVAHFRIVGANAGNQFFKMAEGDPLLLNPAVNKPIENIKALTPTPLIDPTTLDPPQPGTTDPIIRLTTSGLPAIDKVDGFLFDVGGADFTQIPHIVSSRFAAASTVTELIIANTSAAHHPWHFHGFSMQPIRISKCDPDCSGAGAGPPDADTAFEFDYNEFVDTIDVAPGHAITYKVRLDDRVLTDFVTPGGNIGRWAFHCHIFFHAGLGMISEFVVVPQTAPAALASRSARAKLSFPIVRLQPPAKARAAPRGGTQR
jgi:FtsP/CotA-like multicopper oxidase with cupredoxin domain